MFKAKFLMLLMGAMLYVNSAYAQMDISLGAVQRYFLANERAYQTLKVSNNNASKAFEVEAVLKMFTNLDSVNKLDKEDYKMEVVDNHFLFAPKKFVLEPKTSRAVRMVRTEAITDKERVYTLAYKPKEVTVKKGDDASPNKVVMGGISSNTSAGILVYVSPKNPVFNVSFTRDENGVTLFNEGNITSEMRMHRNYCYESSEGEGCMELPPERLSPGEKFFFKIEPHIPLVWTARAYDAFNKKLKIAPFE